MVFIPYNLVCLSVNPLDLARSLISQFCFSTEGLVRSASSSSSTGSKVHLPEGRRSCPLYIFTEEISGQPHTFASRQTSSQLKPAHPTPRDDGTW